MLIYFRSYLFHKMTRLLFELLPNEILLHIFQYFDVRDLYQSFYGLNSRLNAILKSKQNLSVMFSSPDEMDNPYLDLFTKHINKLIVDHSSYINIQLFSSLHSLILNSPSEEQLEQIYNCKFPYLVHLEFGVMNNELGRRSLYKFLRCKQFPSIQTCIFHHENHTISSNCFRNTLPSVFTLRRIWLNSIDLLSCPDIDLNSQHNIFSIDPVHLSLKRFDICCISSGPTIVEIDRFLVQTPNLERFKIASNKIYHSYECLREIASILQRRLIHLSRFDCELQFIMSPEEIDKIHKLHPCFDRIKYQSEHGSQCVRLYTE